MATLCLAERSETTAAGAAVRSIETAYPALGLREWLAGDWGMVFSHPEDFQDGGLEQDRWLTIVGEEFHASAVRPLACSVGTIRLDGSWVSHLTADWRMIKLEGAVADLTARLLRADLSALQSRFVLIVDEHLRRRGLLRYEPERMRLSPLDLLASVSALRRRPAAARRAA